MHKGGVMRITTARGRGARARAVVPLAALALVLAGCGGSDDGGGSGGTLKAGTEGTYAPFTFHDPKAGNKLTGYDVDVLEAVAAKLGKKVEWSEVTFDSIFAGLESKRYDVVANQITV